MAFVRGTGNFKSSAIKDHIISKLHSKAASAASVKDKQNSDPATADLFVFERFFF